MRTEDGRTEEDGRTHTHQIFEALYTISPGGQKVDLTAFYIFMGCWLLQTSRKYQFVAAPSLKSLCDEY